MIDNHINFAIGKLKTTSEITLREINLWAIPIIEEKLISLGYSIISKTTNEEYGYTDILFSWDMSQDTSLSSSQKVKKK